MPIDAARAKSVFLAASDLPDRADRAAYLDRECGDDATLRGRVEALLRANDAAPMPEPGVADAPATATFGTGDAAPTADHPGKDERAGAVIGEKYTLVESIGEGGMGAVWRAKQTEPVKRFVAVKLIKAGMDSKQVLARFEAERQALALMDHPNIAKVLDGGLHDGRPFFVMELVKGVPVTEYCDTCKLTPRERLELFVPVCQAIQHAHQKGVIHRDIKPNNVLIALYDDKPVVKVIDFGVAKATGAALTEHTIDTGFGAVVGTPQYMSPEQATFNNLDIDTRSDVYALGVLLYELLTGSPPFSKKELAAKGLMEMLRVVREEEPPRPSTKLSTADALPTLSANRGTEPKKLTGLLRNELDWIVMKALEKDRTRRYETANGFAADVLRYLGDEAVQAHPPSTSYRLKKFVRRYKGRVIAASLVLFALLAGIAGTTWGLVEAKRQQAIAWDEAEAKELARQAEQAQRVLAEQNAARAKAAVLGERQAKQDAVEKQIRAEAAGAAEKAAKEQTEKRLTQIEKGIDLLGSIFRDLDPRQEEKAGKQLRILLGERLDTATEELEGDSIGDPVAVAKLQLKLALCQYGLGYSTKAVALGEKARRVLTAALGADHHQSLDCLTLLAGSYLDAGQVEAALPLAVSAWERSKAKYGADTLETLRSMNTLGLCYMAAGKYADAIPLLEATHRATKSRLGSRHTGTIVSLNNLASAYWRNDQIAQALPLMEEALDAAKLAFGDDHIHTLICLDNLATGYRDSGAYAKAIPLHEAAVRGFTAKLGPDHPSTLTALGNRADCYRLAGQVEKAVPLLEAAYRAMRAKQGADHPATLVAQTNLAAGYQALGRTDEAVSLLEAALRTAVNKYGTEHSHAVEARSQLATGYLRASQFEKALPLLAEAHATKTAKFGAGHAAALVGQAHLAECYVRSGRREKGLPLAEETLEAMRQKLGNDHAETLGLMDTLAEVYAAAGQFQKAVPLWQESHRISREKLGTDHIRTLTRMGNLASGYLVAGEVEKALPLLEETLRMRTSLLGPEHLETLTAANNLAQGYRDAGDLGKALPLFEANYKTRLAKLGANHPDTITGLGNLAKTELEADRTAEALEHFEDFVSRQGRQVGAESIGYAGLLAAVSRDLSLASQFRASEKYLRECLRIREKVQPDAWTTFNTRSMLGGALLGQKKYAEAEAVLVTGYEGMKRREKTIPPPAATRLPESIDRLIDLYTATNKPDEAKKWRDERAKYLNIAPPPRAKK